MDEECKVSSFYYTSESGYNGDSFPVVSSSSMQFDENLVDNSQVHHDDHECNDTSYDWSPDKNHSIHIET